MPMSFHPLIFSRIKLLAGMDIAVRRRPQDGHYTYNSNSNHIFDVRVSTLPGQFGEKLALRLLDQRSDTGTTQIGSTRFFQK